MQQFNVKINDKITPGNITYDIIFSTTYNNILIQEGNKNYKAKSGIKRKIPLVDNDAGNIQINELKQNIEIILSNITEGILLLRSGLEISYSNERFNNLFGKTKYKNIKELFGKEIYENIYNFSISGNNKYIFEWVIGTPENPILVSIILKPINKNYLLLIASEIKDVLTKKELQNCYYIIRGFSERETAKILFKGRTTVNSNKARATEKLIRNNYTTMLKYL